MSARGFVMHPPHPPHHSQRHLSRIISKTESIRNPVSFLPPDTHTETTCTETHVHTETHTETHVQTRAHRNTQTHTDTCARRDVHAEMHT